MFNRRTKPNQPQDYDMTIKLLVNVITILNGLADGDNTLSDDDKANLSAMSDRIKLILESIND